MPRIASDGLVRGRTWCKFIAEYYNESYEDYQYQCAHDHSPRPDQPQQPPRRTHRDETQQDGGRKPMNNMYELYQLENAVMNLSDALKLAIGHGALAGVPDGGTLTSGTMDDLRGLGYDGGELTAMQNGFIDQRRTHISNTAKRTMHVAKCAQCVIDNVGTLEDLLEIELARSSNAKAADAELERILLESGKAHNARVERERSKDSDSMLTRMEQLERRLEELGA